MAVVVGPVSRFEERHPTGTDVALVVEISVTSQRHDQAKAAVYARAGVPVYWNLDLAARRLVEYRAPRPERAEYAETRVYVDGELVTIGGTALAVIDLLPPA